MNVNITPKRLLATAISAFALTVALLAIGVMLGTAISKESGSPSTLKLMASGSSAGKNVSLATGQIDEGNEGIYILDHLNGNLQCWLINPRTNKIGGVYRANIFDALPDLKQGDDLDFVLTTGNFNFQNRGNQQLARSIAFVGVGKSGVVAGFGFRFDKTVIQRGNIQEGTLEVVVNGPIRDLQIREQ